MLIVRKVVFNDRTFTIATRSPSWGTIHGLHIWYDWYVYILLCNHIQNHGYLITVTIKHENFYNNRKKSKLCQRSKTDADYMSISAAIENAFDSHFLKSIFHRKPGTHTDWNDVVSEWYAIVRFGENCIQGGRSSWLDMFYPVPCQK